MAKVTTREDAIKAAYRSFGGPREYDQDGYVLLRCHPDMVRDLETVARFFLDEVEAAHRKMLEECCDD